MSEFVSQTLEDWGFTNLINYFKDEDVDEESFNMLTDEAINSIIPQWGWRVKFKNKYETFRNSESLSENSESNKSITVLTQRLSAIQSPSHCTENTSLESNYKESSSSIKTTSLKSFLLSTLQGQIILKKYEKTKKIDRTILCSLIINSELLNSEDYKINDKRFRSLAEDISQLFPSELRELYYISRTVGQDGLIFRASGALYEKYNNIRRELNGLGMIRKKRSTLDDTQTTSVMQYQNEEDDDILWLRTNLEPFDIISEKWKATIAKRAIYREDTVADYFNLFKCLKSSTGHLLLAEDFSHNFPNKDSIFFEKWPNTARQIIEISKNKKCPDLKLCINKYKDRCEDSLLALLMLPLMFGSVNVKSEAPGSHWRPDKTHTRNSFLLHIETEDELVEFQTKRDQLYKKYKLSVQPHVVICGPIENLISSSVYVNNIKYILESPEKAIDLCIKLVYSLNAKFTAECEPTWIFLANYIYEFKEKHSFHSVFSLINKLKKTD